MVLGTDRRVLVLALARMADAVGNSFLIIVLPLYIASGQIEIAGLTGSRLLGFVVTEEFLIGFVLSLFGFLNSFLQPFTGRASDRTGRRRLFILAGLAVLGLSSAAYPFVTAYWAVVVIRALQGVGVAFAIPATIALVNDYARSDRERGGNFGVFNTFRLIGFGFGPIVAGAVVVGGFSRAEPVTYVVADRLGPVATPETLAGARFSGFDAAFAVAVLGAAASFALVAWLIDDPAETEAEATEDLSIAVLDRDGDRTFDPVFALGVATLFMAVTIALFATLQETINDRLAQGSTLFGLQFSAVVIGNVLLQVPVGRAADRFGRRPFLVFGFVLLAPAVLAQGVVRTPEAMLVARLLHGVAVAAVFAPGLAVAGDLARGGQSGTTLSVLTMAFGLGIAIGPLASGFLVSFGFVVPFAAGALLALVALVFVVTQVEETLGADERVDEPGDATPQD